MIFYGHYRSIFNHCDIIDLKSCRIPWKKRKIRAITAFKVIQGHRGRYQSKAHMRVASLLVINSNRHPISYRFGVIAAYCSHFAPMLSLWLKISGRRGRPPAIIFARIVRPMNVLQLCPWQFSHSCYGWGATRKNRSKIGDLHQRGHFDPKFQVQGVAPPPIIFAKLGQWIMPYNFAADSFHTKKLCSRLSSSEVHCLMKIGCFAFWGPLWGP